MASIRFSQLVSEIRGSAGGNTFSRNANGAYVRNRVKGANPNSPRQQAARFKLSAVAGAWRGLTPANRASYQDQTPAYPYINRLGETKTYTGQQLFMSLASNLASIGVAPNPNCMAPITMDQPDLLPVIFKVIAGTIDDIAVGVNNFEAGELVQVHASAPNSNGVFSKPAGGYVNLGNIAMGEDELNITAQYSAQFGANGYVTGQKIFFKARAINADTGQATGFTFIDMIVVV